MKTFILILLCIAFMFPQSENVYAEEVELYSGKVEHLFTHELVYDTAKAFSASNPVRSCFDKDHLTTNEFKALLEELYANNYVLISFKDYIDYQTLEFKDIYLPKGKKPMTLSFDDMTYDTIDLGCINKLMVDAEGEVCDYSKNAKPQLSYERENITILEGFIKTHPDFSINNARATICVNGYNGILGYRITPLKEIPETYRLEEIENCKKLVSVLKEKGYEFASHTYYHHFINNISSESMAKDCKMWRAYVEPIVGETKVLCYPGGVHRHGSAHNAILKNYGFKVFLCVGLEPTSKEKETTDIKYIYRRPVDGTALRIYKEQYKDIINTSKIYDSEHRYRSFNYKGGYGKIK